MEEEIVDIVNEQDEVIGSAPRRGIHKTNAKHRAAHIFLFNNEGKIWLEKRSSNCDIWAGYCNSSAAGHVSSGETYEEGAHREVEEELGIKNLELHKMGMLQPSEETYNEFVAFFIAKSSLSPRLHEGADEQNLYGVEEIGKMIKEGKLFTPIFLRLFAMYCGMNLKSD